MIVVLNEEELKQIGEKVEEVGTKLINAGRKNRHIIKSIKRRLYAYPQLKDNIERYKLDIEDLKQQKEFGKSKSIVSFNSGQIAQMDKEELNEQIRAEKIRECERHIARDEAEIKDIEQGLLIIKEDPYYKALEMSYFEGKKQKEIAEAIPCVETTIWRNIGRLIDKLAIFWYGADALKE